MNWSQPSKASDAVKPWGKPDAPKISVTNDDTTGTVTVESVGNTRNAGCKAVEISGDVSASIDGCSGSYDFKIPDHDLNTREYTIKAAVVGKEKTTSDDSTVRFTPKYAVKAPESVSVKGHDDVCVVSWKENGHADGFTVSADGLGSYHAERFRTIARFPAQGMAVLFLRAPSRSISMARQALQVRQGRSGIRPQGEGRRQGADADVGRQ